MIKLRKYQKEDNISLAKNGDNPKVAAYMRNIFPSPYRTTDAQWWIAEGHLTEGSFNLVIDLNGECIGNIGIHSLEGHDKNSVELGYWIGEAHWNKGITSHAISLLTEQVFSKHGVTQLTALVAAPNVGSMKALEKCGFKCTEVKINSLEVRAGIFDEHVFVKNI